MLRSSHARSVILSPEHDETISVGQSIVMANIEYDSANRVRVTIANMDMS